MIKGEYVDRRLAVVSPHAIERYLERIDASAKAPEFDIREAWRLSQQLFPQCWWVHKATSYWVHPPRDLMLIVKRSKSGLAIATCLRMSEATPGNPKAAAALKALRKEARG
jgi:hypothetical protein